MIHKLTTPQRRLLKLLSETGNNIRRDRLAYRHHLYTRAGTYIETVNNTVLEALIRRQFVTRVIINKGPFYEFQISVLGLMALQDSPAAGAPIDIRPKHNRRHEN